MKTVQNHVEKYINRTVPKFGPVLRANTDPTASYIASLINSTVFDLVKNHRLIKSSLIWNVSIEWACGLEHWDSLLSISKGTEEQTSEDSVTLTADKVHDLYPNLRASLSLVIDGKLLDVPQKTQFLSAFIDSIFDNVGLELFTLMNIASGQCSEVRYNVAQKMLELSSLIFEEGVIDSFMTELVVMLNEYTFSEVSSMSLTTWNKDEGVFHIPAVFEKGKMALENEKFPLMILQNRPIYQVIETGKPLLLSRSKSQEILSKVNIHRTKASATVIMPLSLGTRGGALTICSSQCEIFNGLELACFTSAASAVGTVYRRNMLQSKTYQQANFDILTGLANRSNFERFLSQLEMEENECSGLLYIDLDKFKQVNDTYGHDVGDQFLKIVASRFSQQLRDHDLAARRGGDEFAIVLCKLQGSEVAERVAKRILNALESPVVINGISHEAGVSIGICVFDSIVDVSLAIKRADHAMYKAKEAGGGCYQFYSE
jgi:diguanylate cyclase (GGDEF)-like protein